MNHFFHVAMKYSLIALVVFAVVSWKFKRTPLIATLGRIRMKTDFLKCRHCSKPLSRWSRIRREDGFCGARCKQADRAYITRLAIERLDRSARA
jgi:hypothetical protein